MGLRVFMVSTSWPLRKGDSAGVFVRDLAVGLTGHGTRVDVLAPHFKGAPLEEQVDGVRVRRVWYAFPASWQTLCYGHGMDYNLAEKPVRGLLLPPLLLAFFWRTLLGARQADVIHAHWAPAGLAAITAARLLGKPVILGLHHGQGERDMGRVERWAVEHADHVVCNSRYNYEKVLKLAAPRDCSVIPPGVDTDRFRPGLREKYVKRVRAGLGNEAPLIFTAGRLVELKGYHHLIDALVRLKDRHDFQLMLAGTGPMREDLRARAEAGGIADRVRFLGFVPTDEIPGYFASADLFVQPSIVDRSGSTEGLGMTVLEAMACETPCVGSAVGGITDTIQDGRTGFLARPGDPADLAEKISAILDDKVLHYRMRRECRRFVLEHYAAVATAAKMLSLYKELAT